MDCVNCGSERKRRLLHKDTKTLVRPERYSITDCEAMIGEMDIWCVDCDPHTSTLKSRLRLASDVRHQRKREAAIVAQLLLTERNSVGYVQYTLGDLTLTKKEFSEAVRDGECTECGEYTQNLIFRKDDMMYIPRDWWSASTLDQMVERLDGSVPLCSACNTHYIHATDDLTWTLEAWVVARESGEE